MSPRRPVQRAVLATACVVAALAAVAPATTALADTPATTVRPPAPVGPATIVRLSDEHLRTYWSRPLHLAPIRRAPDPRSRPLARLRWFTEDGYPEVYVVLRAAAHPRLGRWLQVRIPGRPNGRTGWVRVHHLEPLRLVRTHLIVDRRRLRATLYDRGRVIWRAPVGVGTRSTPTPAGRFYVRERLRAGGGIYGPWAFGTSAYSRLSDWPGGGVVGIHGTNQPGLIPGRPSHGCIRVKNPAIRRLARLMPVGTPVLVL